MEFTCTKCGEGFIRLSGWKRHMSRKHGGYDEADMAEVTGAQGVGAAGSVESRMREFIAGLPPEEGEYKDMPSTPPPPAAPAPPPVKTIKATPKKLKKILAAIPTKMLEASGLELDEEDKVALEEAGEFLTDIFGIEFEIEQDKHVLKSRFWAIVWVGGVVALIYVKHRFKDLWQKIYEQYQKAASEQKAA